MYVHSSAVLCYDEPNSRLRVQGRFPGRTSGEKQTLGLTLKPNARYNSTPRSQALIPDVSNSIHPPSPPSNPERPAAYARRPASQAALPGAVFEPLGDALSSAAVKSKATLPE
ncbi:uncharacterized protein RAG0_08028 [Rhynchosporium agropyri]|uniref:Uncharacterized protein n=1 Tax=Rhynchosporium agropyri TaxID=914238 RepID=A0A1E1KP02_9HELO|nr:uncharacterized protein RAG0_08028 [Rhynchosporium agropyri]